MKDAVRAFAGNLSVPVLRNAQLAFGAGWASEWAFTVGISIVAFRDGGAAAVGLVALLRLSPAIVVGPLASTLADRFPRDRMLIGIGLTRAVSIGLGALLLDVRAGHVLVYALAVIATAALTPFRAAHSALVPSLCRTPGELASAMIVRGMLDSLSVLLGPLLAAVLLPSFGPVGVLSASAAGSLLSALLVLRLRYEPAPRVGTLDAGSLVGRMVDGIRAIVATPFVALLCGMTFVQALTRGFLTVFTVVVAVDMLKLGDSGVGLLNAAVGAGAVVGSLAASLLVGSRRLGGWFGVAVAAWGAPLALIGAFPSEASALVMLACIGAANATLDVALFTLLGRLVDDHVMGRVFGVLESGGAAAVGIGGITASSVIAAIGIRGALVVLGSICPAVAVAGWASLRRLDNTLVVRTREIEVLQAVPMLRALPVVTVEQLARAVQHASIPEGTLVCAQGDPADTFYVIQEGEAEVIGDGHLVRVLHAGDHFGEIALLRDVARTATVRARTRILAAVLTRELFLPAVTGYGSSVREADAIVTARLAELQSHATPRSDR